VDDEHYQQELALQTKSPNILVGTNYFSNFGSCTLTTGYLEFLFHATHFKIHEQFKIVNYIFQVILAKIKLNLIAVLL